MCRSRLREIQSVGPKRRQATAIRSGAGQDGRGTGSSCWPTRITRKSSRTRQQAEYDARKPEYKEQLRPEAEQGAPYPAGSTAFHRSFVGESGAAASAHGTAGFPFSPPHPAATTEPLKDTRTSLGNPRR